jgi:hypothetical protein
LISSQISASEVFISEFELREIPEDCLLDPAVNNINIFAMYRREREMVQIMTRKSRRDIEPGQKFVGSYHLIWLYFIYHFNQIAVSMNK